jgi:hypothetical protein
MGGFSARELRAIRFFTEATDSVPQMTTYPQVRAKVRKTGENLTKHIDILLEEYDESRKQAAKERAIAKREAEL